MQRTREMENYYDLLGLTQSATEAEIRKAYRDLARRFHPDINPDKNSEDKFKAITEGYNVLTNINERKKYDRELDRFLKKTINKKFNAYRTQQAKARTTRPAATERYYNAQKEDYENIKNFQTQRRSVPADKKNKSQDSIFNTLKTGFNRLSDGARSIFFEPDAQRQESTGSTTAQEAEAYQQKNPGNGTAVSKISIIEVSVTMNDVLTGVKKTVEIEEADGMRKIRVAVPAGVRSGSVVRMRSASKPEEELVLVIRVAKHPFMQIDSRGLIVDVPITPHEAVTGASIKVPTLEEEQILLKIPPGSQSGEELRVKGKGIADRSGTGDIYYRLLIQLPVNPLATGIADSAETLSRYYTAPLRMDMPKSLKDIATAS